MPLAVAFPEGVHFAYVAITATAAFLGAVFTLARYARPAVRALVGLHTSLEALPQLAGDIRDLAGDTAGLMRAFLDFLGDHETEHQALQGRLGGLEEATARLEARVTIIDRRTGGTKP